MRETRLLMGMPITVDVADRAASCEDIEAAFSYFQRIDAQFSTYKIESEISRINRGDIVPERYSNAMRSVFALAEKTRRETRGYFDIRHGGSYDPSGIVKGLAIFGAAKILCERGFINFFVDAGGDIQTSGRNNRREPWRVGVRSPFLGKEIVKVLSVSGEGVATSGTYLRGKHIWNPGGSISERIVSFTVVGPNIVEADRFATAAFAMGEKGIVFIEQQPALEGYMIDRNGVATFTSGLSRYTNSHAGVR